MLKGVGKLDDVVSIGKKVDTPTTTKSTLNDYDNFGSDTLDDKLRNVEQDFIKNVDNASGAAEGVADLLNAASAPSKGELTAVGRALQKHGSRSGSLFPKATGNAASMNAQGKSVLQNIISHPNASTVTRHHRRFGNIMEIKIPNGQGARFSADGKTFFGFIE
ncbi:MAG: hypothetical protein WBA74_06660 [Cyclobacteriaceae bacterium]